MAFGRLRGTENELRPFTTANAMRHGWSWNIPLWARDGTGYVYSSAFCDRAEAEREMVAFLGTEAEITEPNHLTMRVGKSRRTWVGNCVAVGLAGGFIEPLESTGLLTVEIGVDQLAQTLEGGDYDDVLRDAFNDGFSQLYDNIRDFLVLHFRTATRRDTDYWRACTGDPLMVPGASPTSSTVSSTVRCRGARHGRSRSGRGCTSSTATACDPAGPFAPVRVPSAVDARAAQRREDRAALAHALPSTREFLRDLRARYEAGARATAALPTTDDVWQANYDRSFWGPEHEAFVHGAW